MLNIKKICPCCRINCSFVQVTEDYSQCFCTIKDLLRSAHSNKEIILQFKFQSRKIHKHFTLFIQI